MSCFAFAIFTGAFLLFQVQPLIAKYILPWFGGTPSVWGTCMVFFQVMLLAGYAYAHWSAHYLKPKTQAKLHLALIVVAIAFLPVIPDAHWKPSDPSHPAWRILKLLAANIGMPYFVLSATGPLMQQWFTLSNRGVSPYRLYVLSNVGSLLALVTFPFVFEPHFSRPELAHFWSWGLIFYAVLMVLCAWRIWGVQPLAAQPSGLTDAATDVDQPPRAGAKLMWLLLSTCAAMLLLAVTNKLCRDVAVIPFLWVLPLGIYLLSFILCFDNPRGYGRKFFGIALAPTLVVCWLIISDTTVNMRLQILFYSWLLFIGCMICNGELYRARPAPRYLTYFYLMIAAGGALGGMFVGLAAPLIFADYRELQWGLVLLLLTLVLLHWRENSTFIIEGRHFKVWPAVAGGSILLILSFTLHLPLTYKQIAVARNFYGVLKVWDANSDVPGLRVRVLIHGTTMHGIQALDRPDSGMTPTGYYHRQSGIGLVMRLLQRQEERRIGIVGLGTGTISAYGRAGDVIRYYEINPTVVQFAEEKFKYLSNSPARVEIEMGDARLSLEREPDQQFDVLVLDAFSGDSIPVHLLTREAFEIYLRHLKPDGVIAVHISNSYLNLLPVMNNLAEHFKLPSAYLEFTRKADTSPLVFTAQWFIMTQNRELLAMPEMRAAVTPLPPDMKQVPLWTDDYASLFPVLR